MSLLVELKLGMPETVFLASASLFESAELRDGPPRFMK